MISPELQAESERLARSWLQHDATMLRDYLVSSVEDPRLNFQSVLSRHFVLQAAVGDRFSALMRQESVFSAAMNWLVALAGRVTEAEELELVLYALRKGADNADGIEVPNFLGQAFAGLPAAAGDVAIPNYIESFLAGTSYAEGKATLHEPSLNTFRDLWWQTLLPVPGGTPPPARGHSCPQQGTNGTMSPIGTRWPCDAAADRNVPAPGEAPSLLEPACGSANDYRFLDAYGIAPLVRYAGFDLCTTNVENARKLFPQVCFDVGNVFDIQASDQQFDLCVVHDLFEHLSPAGLERAVKEVCRVTRLGLCVGFFNMDEIPEHQVLPVDEYHWNRLSMARMRERFAESGFAAQVVHIGTFLRHRLGCDYTHNPNAYTFLLQAHSPA